MPWDSEAKVQLARALSAGSAERAGLLAYAVTDKQAAYKLRAEAARLAAPQSVTGVSATELALLSSPAVTAEAAARPYQVEGRIDAARTAANPEVRLRLSLEALAIAPADDRARLGALRAAIALRRDSLSLSLEETRALAQLSDRERAAIAESLAAAAERLDDLDAAQAHLRAAISLTPQGQNDALNQKLSALTAEQDRRTENAARRPAIKNIIEQSQIVRPRILRSTQ